MGKPWWAMTVGEPEEQPFDLHAPAVFQQLLETAGAQGSQALGDHIHILKGFACGKLGEKLQEGSFRGRDCQRPFRMREVLTQRAGLKEINALALFSAMSKARLVSPFETGSDRKSVSVLRKTNRASTGSLSSHAGGLVRPWR